MLGRVPARAAGIERVRCSGLGRRVLTGIRSGYVGLSRVGGSDQITGWGRRRRTLADKQANYAHPGKDLPVTSPLDLCDLRTRVQAAVDAEMRLQRSVLAPVGDELGPLIDAVERLIAGGKRLRAGFLYWGYRASGRPDSDALVRLAAAMEFFQAAALLHDDVMDGSDT